MQGNELTTIGKRPRNAQTKRHDRARKVRRQVSLERLEDRTLLSYTFTGGGTNTGTATGDASGDTLYLQAKGGLIEHSTDNVTYSSDWGGGLTIAADAANTINIFQGPGPASHAVVLGGSTASASALKARINVNNGGASYSLLVDDSTDATQGVYTISASAYTGPALDVHVIGFMGLGRTLLGGTQDNTFNINSTFSNESSTVTGNVGADTFNVQSTSSNTTLNTGAGDDTVNVFASGTAVLDIHGQSGTDTVTLGGSTSAPLGMQGLHGTINVDNASGSTDLVLDDSQDTTARSATLANDGTNGQVTVLSPATINYVNAGTDSLTVHGGSGGNTFDVNGTLVNAAVPNTLTTLDKGSGPNNTVNVTATSAGSALDLTGSGSPDTVNLGANLAGTVHINEATGSTNLVLDLSGDGLAHNFVLSSDGTTSTLHDTLGNLAQDVTFVTASLASFTLDTSAAADETLNVDFSTGNPIPTGSAAGLIFNAGADFGNTHKHALNLMGTLPSGPFTSETHNANDETVFPQIGQYGSIFFTDSTGVNTGLDYTGTLPINDTAGAVTYTFKDFADDQSFTATSTTIGATPAIQFANTPATPPPTFETTDVANKTHIIFNTPDKGAAVTGVVNIPTASAGLANLTFNIPANADNTVSFIATPPSPVATALNGGPEEDITNVTGKGVPTGTTLTLNGGGSTNTLNYNAGGLIPTVSAGANPHEVIIALPGFGTVDATNYQTVNITDVGTLAITPGPAATINSIEGFRLTDAVVGTFTAPLAGVSIPASNFTASIDWGDPSPDLAAGTITQDASNTSVYYITGTHTFAEQGTFTVASTIAFAGGTFTSNVNGVAVSVSVGSSAPTAGTPATARVTQGTLAVSVFPIVGTEGATIASGPIATFIDAGGANPVGDYSATVTVINSAGATVLSVPAASITQVGTSAQFTVIAPALTLPEEGTYQVVVAVTDSDTPSPLTASGAGIAVIADGALTPGAAGTQAANTGVPLTAANNVVGSFTDSNSGAAVTDFTGTIDWGDGSPNSVASFVKTGAGAFNATGNHTYAKPGAYTVTTNVVDDGGARTTLVSTFTITDLPVTGAVRNFGGVEGQDTGTIVLATFEDPNTLATVANVTASLPANGWGDNTPTAAQAPVTLAVVQIGTDPANGNPIFHVLGSHKYADEGTFTVNIDVTTSGGAVTHLTAGTATVVDARLTSSNGPSITGIEGSPTFGPAAGTLLGTFTDANQGSTVADFTTAPGSVVVNWGDATAPQTLAAANLTASGSPDGVIYTINASHTYAEAGIYAYTVTVTDDGGAVTVISGTAIILDAKLTASATQPAVNTTEAALFPVPVFAPPVFRGPVASFTDGNATATTSDFTALIDWGDGTPLSAGRLSQSNGVGPAFIVSGSHTYADSGVNGAIGAYDIQVFVQDVDGSRLTLANTASVTDRPIVLTGILNPASDSGKFNNDAITNVTQPNFYGTSEPFSHVVLSANGTMIGQAQAGSDGAWSITSNHLADGSYAITATATDQFGITTAGPVTIVPNLQIDTVGPRITYAAFDRLTGTEFFTFQDTLADGTTPGGSGPLAQSLSDAANYYLNRVHAPKVLGRYIVTDITVTPGATPASEDVTVVFNNGAFNHGGWFRIIARAASVLMTSGIQDVAGNALDGEFYGQQSASGNGVPGGDFVANIYSQHQNTPGFGYSGPLTIIGYPHPNDPSSKVPPIQKPVRKPRTVEVHVKKPARTAIPKPTKPARTAIPKPTKPARTAIPKQVAIPRHTNTASVRSSAPMSLGAWNSIRQRLIQSAAGARGLR
jgi:hypothetical protein